MQLYLKGILPARGWCPDGFITCLRWWLKWYSPRKNDIYKNGAWKSTSTYLWVFCFFPRKFQGRSVFLKLDVEGPFLVRGWNQDPPKLLSDSSCQMRYAVRFVFTNRFWSPFLGDDIFLGSILDILWYLLLLKLYHYIISELISQKWTDFDGIKWCGCWSVVKYGLYEKKMKMVCL